MSQEHLDQAAALFDAIQRGDSDGVRTLLHPEFEFHAAIGTVDQRVYIGSDGMWAFVEDMDAIWDGYRVQVEEIRESGERVVALIRIAGTARVSGVPLNQRLGQIITWQDGTIWRMVAYTSSIDALKAAGLEE
jgi:ketosteroid isomerase-like protein